MKLLSRNIIDWLLAGDVSIQYQTHRDLLQSDENILNSLQKRIETEGWGKGFLDARSQNGYWGRGFYMPKWTSTHYTLLDLKNLCLPCNNINVCQSTQIVLELPKGENGGINFAVTIPVGDVCVNGMILNYGSYFCPDNKRLQQIVDYLLKIQMPDGGWNCEYYKGASHSSLHSTIGVLEGLSEFFKTKNTYKIQETEEAVKKGVEFLLVHHLFKSHHTGAIIDPKMMMLSYPSRWKYDLLRALDYLQSISFSYDERMLDAIMVLKKKQNTDGTWPLQHKHSGQVHFDMETTGQPSRWNTLRAMRVLNHFNKYL